MEDDMSDEDKFMLKYMVCVDYLHYCKKACPDSLFLIGGDLLNLRSCFNVIHSCKDVNSKVFDDLIDIMDGDAKFQKMATIRLLQCESCGSINTEEKKLSKYHPDWLKYQNDCAVEESLPVEQILKKPRGVYHFVCNDCNHFYQFSCGVDEDPEHGLR